MYLNTLTIVQATCILLQLNHVRLQYLPLTMTHLLVRGELRRARTRITARTVDHHIFTAVMG